MAKKKLLSEFGLKVEEINENIVNDYDAFQNKELLDELRNKIIQNLIDHNLTGTNNNELIKDEINKTIK